jgi:hypothetical protein
MPSPKEEIKLRDGTRVINFTGFNHAYLREHGYGVTFCFGYIFGTMYIGDHHHAEIMAWIMEHENKGWEDLMTAEQRWGWCTTEQNATKLRVQFSTDDALQTPGLAQRVLDIFDEYLDVDAYTNDADGHTTQSDYGRRTRVQYQGEYDEDEEYYKEVCDYCGKRYDPEWESHGQEYCETCGEYYCDGQRQDHEHPECEHCGESYDENNKYDYEEHNKPYCRDCGEHFNWEDHFYHRKDDTNVEQVQPGTQEWEKIVNWAKSYFKMNILLLNDPKYSQTIYDIQKKYITDGISGQWKVAPTTATQILQDVLNPDEQLKLFSKWQDLDELPINRGIHDNTDRWVFAKLAAEALAGEDPEVLDIEANPYSKEYRWSYDGHDLHIWQVTNRKMYGPSHYDMFGETGYGEHSQGRVYVSPEGRVASLYWQISHPECEDVINQWIQKTFGKPPDAIYRAYGQYAGEVRPRWYFPLVDVSGLPMKPYERWWENPDARKPNAWYLDKGMEVPPLNTKTYPAKPQPKFQPPAPAVNADPNVDYSDPRTWSDLPRSERRRLRRERRRKQQRNRRSSVMHLGSFNVITYDWKYIASDGSDGLVHKFVFDSKDNFIPAKTADYNLIGGTHHGDLLGEDFVPSLMSGKLATNGFFALEPIEVTGIQLENGDLWFHDTPSPEEIQIAKKFFTDKYGKVKRIRWYGMYDNQDF